MNRRSISLGATAILLGGLLGCRAELSPQGDAVNDRSEADSAVISLSEGTFAATVLDNPQPVLVDFWAAWCKPCHQLRPILEQVAADFATEAVIASLNIDEHRRIADSYEIRALPTLLIFSRGEVVDRIEGLATRHEISERLAEWTAHTR